MAVWADVESVEEHLVVPHPRVAVLEVGAALPQGLDLRSLEDDTGFDALQDGVVVIGLPVLADEANFPGLRDVCLGFSHVAPPTIRPESLRQMPVGGDRMGLSSSLVGF